VIVKILLVDDTPSILYSVSLILKFENFQCESASLVDEAMKMVRAAYEEGSPFELVLLDLMMPGKPPSELIEYLKQYGSPKILVFSASVDTADEAKRLGADGYILKPFVIDTLLESITRYQSVTLSSTVVDFETTPASGMAMPL
jgi:DNA-binding response OmpR family regulator